MASSRPDSETILAGSSQAWIDGKTCIITGSNSGIGKATATALARMGATVVMVCRDKTKGEDARREVIAKSGAAESNLELMLADLSSLDSVRSLAAEFLETGEKLHVLVNNAGVILGERHATKDGLETTFVVNYLSHFLLTNLLVDNLKSAAPSRVINVTSDASRSAHMYFDDLQLEKGYGAIKAYGQSKLAQVLFTNELAKKLQGTGVTSNCLHPGAAATNWGRHSAGALSFFLRAASPFMISSEKAAETAVFLASSPDVTIVSGKFFYKKREAATSPECNDEASARRLWQVSLALSGLPSDA